MNINYTKGFTLIELLVVIAIIGILSTVVLGQLSSARTKAGDAAVKNNINNMRSYAESQYDVGRNGYQNLCSDSKMTELFNAARNAGGNGGACNAAVGYWVAWAGLKSGGAQAWCADNRGVTYQITPLPTGAITTCP